MSRDAFADFVKKLNTDEELRKAAKERFQGLEGKVPEDELLEFAEEQGYAFTVEEAKEELSEAELEGVTGGTYLKMASTYDSYQFEEIKVTYSTDLSSFYFKI